MRIGTGKDFVIRIGYQLFEWGSNWGSSTCDQQNNCERIESNWDEPDLSNIDSKTLIFSIGLKNWNINNKFW